ncbi:MAG: acetate--CoA ligase family protein [Thermodesulfobacteriota bacterium]
MTGEEIDRLVDRARGEGRKSLTEPEVKGILAARSVPVPKHRLVTGPVEAAEAASEMGYPLVLKVVSGDILHKTEFGGVITGLNTKEEVESAFSEIVMNVGDKDPSAAVEGFLLEEMVGRGVEVIVGSLRDEQFGPAVMFGIGGVAVELMKDVSFRLAPVEKEEALEMMREVKGYPLLTGFRGSEPVDTDAVADVIVKVSRIIDDTEGIKELEINPLMVLHKGAVALDARAVVE